LLLEQVPCSWYKVLAPGTRYLLLEQVPCSWYKILAPGTSSLLLVQASDVQARARSPKPARASPRKPSQARALYKALGGPQLRLQFSQA